MMLTLKGELHSQTVNNFNKLVEETDSKNFSIINTYKYMYLQILNI